MDEEPCVKCRVPAAQTGPRHPPTQSPCGHPPLTGHPVARSPGWGLGGHSAVFQTKPSNLALSGEVLKRCSVMDSFLVFSSVLSKLFVITRKQGYGNGHSL